MIACTSGGAGLVLTAESDQHQGTSRSRPGEGSREPKTQVEWGQWLRNGPRGAAGSRCADPEDPS